MPWFVAIPESGCWVERARIRGMLVATPEIGRGKLTITGLAGAPALLLPPPQGSAASRAHATADTRAVLPRAVSGGRRQRSGGRARRPGPSDMRGDPCHGTRAWHGWYAHLRCHG